MWLCAGRGVRAPFVNALALPRSLPGGEAAGVLASVIVHSMGAPEDERPFVALVAGCPHMSSPSEPCWYALYTRSRFEKEVDRRLCILGLETYLPLYRARRRWSDRTVQLDLPLFPSYLFIRVSPASPDIYRVLDTKGVVRFVSAGTGPIEVPQKEIEAVRRTLSAEIPVRSLPWLREGQKIRVCAGPLHGLEGIVERCNGRGHLYIAIAAIGQTLVAELDCRDVAPLL